MIRTINKMDLVQGFMSGIMYYFFCDFEMAYAVEIP